MSAVLNPLHQTTPLHHALERVRIEASRVILDKTREIDLALCCLIAGGHLLIEDIPGVGKTTLVKALAKLLNLGTSRVQFTNDLLPADILGSSIYDVEKKVFVFIADRSSPNSSLPTSSIVRRQKPRAPASRPWKNEESRLTASRTFCRSHSFWSARKTRGSKLEHFRFRSRSSIAF
jgi:MoxR-like ATPase